jgi:hypothetical protein
MGSTSICLTKICARMPGPSGAQHSADSRPPHDRFPCVLNRVWKHRRSTFQTFVTVRNAEAGWVLYSSAFGVQGGGHFCDQGGVHQTLYLNMCIISLGFSTIILNMWISTVYIFRYLPAETLTAMICLLTEESLQATLYWWRWPYNT